MCYCFSAVCLLHKLNNHRNFFLLQIDIVVGCDLAIIAQCDSITIDNIRDIRQYYHLLLLFLLSTLYIIHVIIIVVITKVE